MTSVSRFIVFYDGHCILCNRVVRWVIKHDKKDVFRFAPLQGSTAKAFFKERKIDSLDLDTVVLWKPDHAYWTQSTAFFEIIKQSILSRSSFFLKYRIVLIEKKPMNFHRFFQCCMGGSRLCSHPQTWRGPAWMPDGQSQRWNGKGVQNQNYAWVILH